MTHVEIYAVDGTIESVPVACVLIVRIVIMDTLASLVEGGHLGKRLTREERRTGREVERNRAAEAVEQQ